MVIFTGSFVPSPSVLRELAKMGCVSYLVTLCCLAYICAAFDVELWNRRYDPLKGFYIDTFDIPNTSKKCPVFLVSDRALYLDGCTSASKHIKRLHYYFNDERIHRIVEGYNGTYLEIPRLEVLYRSRDFPNAEPVPRFTVGAVADTVGSEYKRVMEFEVFGSRDWRAPQEEYLKPLHGEALSSANFPVMNVRTFVIFNLTYDPFNSNYKCSKSFFWVGKGRNGPNARGMQIPDEHGSMKPLKKYKLANITLTLPYKKGQKSDPVIIYDIDYLGIWCPSKNESHGYVETLPQFHRKEMPYPPPNYFNKFHLGMVLCQPPNTFSPVLGFNDTEYCIGAAGFWFVSLDLILVCLLIATTSRGSQ